jgi:hypothetical protein
MATTFPCNIFSSNTMRDIFSGLILFDYFYERIVSFSYIITTPPAPPASTIRFASLLLPLPGSGRRGRYAGVPKQSWQNDSHLWVPAAAVAVNDTSRKGIAATQVPDNLQAFQYQVLDWVTRSPSLGDFVV